VTCLVYSEHHDDAPCHELATVRKRSPVGSARAVIWQLWLTRYVDSTNTRTQYTKHTGPMCMSDVTYRPDARQRPRKKGDNSRCFATAR
jgi:hypothetical protein